MDPRVNDPPPFSRPNDPSPVAALKARQHRVGKSAGNTMQTSRNEKFLPRGTINAVSERYSVSKTGHRRVFALRSDQLSAKGRFSARNCVRRFGPRSPNRSRLDSILNPTRIFPRSLQPRSLFFTVMAQGRLWWTVLFPCPRAGWLLCSVNRLCTFSERACVLAVVELNW